MDFAKIISIAAWNIVFVNGAISWQFGCKACTCKIPEWYCDNNIVGSDIKSFFDVQHRLLYQFCLDGKWCQPSWAFNNVLIVNLVQITLATHLPRCMIINLPELKVIHGRNADIASVDAWAFWNLTELEKIDLSYNKITTIQYGVFSELPVTHLDLSWNEVVFIGRGAFHGMRNLRKLDLSRNYLTLFDESYFALKYILDEYGLEELLISQNKLENINLNAEDFPHLNIVDLSHNRINTVSHNFFSIRDLAMLDLTDNLITELKLLPKGFIRTLRVAFNNLQDPEYVYMDKVVAVALDGNPWMCEEYNSLLQHLLLKNITLLKSNEDKKIYFLTNSERENYPTCYISSGNYSREAFVSFIDLRETYKNRTNQECENSANCPSGRMCKGGRCWDPCKQNVCHEKAICRTNTLSFYCDCPKGKYQNPNTPSSRCYSVECFRDFECGIGKKCNMKEHICAD